MAAVEYGEAQYDWEIDHWGCKWGVCNSSIAEESPRWLRYDFQTPWAPPLAFIKQVSGDWPNLRLILDYEESGGRIRGIATANAGKLEDYCISFAEFEALKNG